MDCGSSGVAGGRDSATRLIIANCNRCNLLIGEFKRQMTAFETLAGYNSMLTSNFLIQTLREVIGKFQTGDFLGFDSSQKQVDCTNQSTSTDDLLFLFPTTAHQTEYDVQNNNNNTRESSQYAFNYPADPDQELHIKQEDDNDSQPPILTPQVETENPRTRTRSQNYGSVLRENGTILQMNSCGNETTTTTTSRGRVVKPTQRHFNRKKTWTSTKNKRNNNNNSKGYSGNYHQNEERDANFTPLTSERLREANEHIKGVRKLDEDGRYRTFYECTICHKSMTVKINAAFHVRRVHFQERLVCPFASAGCTKMFYDCRLRQNHKRKCPFKPTCDLSSNGINNSARMRTQPLTSNMKNSFGLNTKKTTNPNVKKIHPIFKLPVKSQSQSKPIAIKPIKKTSNSIIVSNPFPNFDLNSTLNVKVELERLCLVSPQPSNLLKFISKSVTIKQESIEQIEEEEKNMENEKTDKNNLLNVCRGSLSTHPNEMIVHNEMDLNLGQEMEVGQEKDDDDDENCNNEAPANFYHQQENSAHTGILFVTEEEYAEAMKEEENGENKQEDDYLQKKIEREMQLLHG